jgi:endoglucanase
MPHQRIISNSLVFFAAFLVSVALATVCRSAASETFSSHPAQQILTSGINYDWWAREQLDAPPLSPSQISQLKAAGFRHLRLPLNPRSIGFDYVHLSAANCGQGNSPVETFLHQTLPALRRADMGLVLTIDSTEDKDAIARIVDEAGNGLERILECLVKDAAAADPSYAPRRIVIGNFNEPHLEPALWARLQEKALAAAARAHPSFFFLATPAFPTHLGDLLKLRSLAEPNIGYEFHYYEPYVFTHQGVPSGPPWLRDKVSVRLPKSGNEGEGSQCLARRKQSASEGGGCVTCAAGSSDEFCRDFLRTKAAAFGPDYVRGQFAALAAWANGRFVYIGEYGVNKGRVSGTGADAASRLFWLRTLSSSAKEFGFGRAVFEIGCGMAVSRSTVCSSAAFERLDPLDLDPAVLDALR